MSMHTRQNRQKGSAMVEFALVGIPTIFLLICIFEISRGMWMYETVAHAVRDGARYASVHGLNCTAPPQCNCSPLPSCCNWSNSCVVSVAQIAAVIRDAGVGLDPNQFRVTLNSEPLNSTSPNSGGKGPSTLATLLADNSSFPPQAGSALGDDIVVSGTYPFTSALAMFWPGGGKVTFNAVTLAATSRERIEF